jgi:hypothetical protein
LVDVERIQALAGGDECGAGGEIVHCASLSGRPGMVKACAIGL